MRPTRGQLSIETAFFETLQTVVMLGPQMQDYGAGDWPDLVSLAADARTIDARFVAIRLSGREYIYTTDNWTLIRIEGSL